MIQLIVVLVAAVRRARFSAVHWMLWQLNLSASMMEAPSDARDLCLEQIILLSVCSAKSPFFVRVFSRQALELMSFPMRFAILYAIGNILSLLRYCSLSSAQSATNARCPGM